MSRPGIVLVHSPFVGPSSWLAVAAALRVLGETVIEPVRAAAWDVGPPCYPRLARRIASMIDTAPKTDLILVGHSGAGGVLPSLAEAIGPRVQAAIFVDAILPHPGRSWFETASKDLAARLRARILDGRLLPWNRWFAPEVLARLLPEQIQRDAFIAELRGAPAAYGDEPAPVCPSWPPERLGYLQLSEGYASEAAEAEAAGWLVRRELTDHLAIMTQADRVARSLHSIIAALTEAPRSRNCPP